MKTKVLTERKPDAVKTMREIRDKIDKETAGRNFEQLKKYDKQSAEENKRRARK